MWMHWSQNWRFCNSKCGSGIPEFSQPKYAFSKLFSTLPSDSRDPSVPIMVPTVQTSVLRVVTENFSLSINNCNTGPSMESNSHAPITQTSVSERHNSGVSRSTVQNSESFSMKSLHSVMPSTVLRISKPLPTGIAPENSSYPDATGSDAATSGGSPQFLLASISHMQEVGTLSPCTKYGVPTSCTKYKWDASSPSMRYNVKKFKNIVKLQAQYSGAKKKKKKERKIL